MTDELPPTPVRPRAVPLGTLVLARSERLRRAGGRGLASSVAARHDPRRLTSLPRLSAVGDEVVATPGFEYAPAAAAGVAPAEFVDPFVRRDVPAPVVARAVAAAPRPGVSPAAGAPSAAEPY